MTTPTASAAIPINPSDLYRNNSSRSSGHASASASARGTGPVDLDETQNSIDSTTLDTNNQVASGASASVDVVEGSSYEQNPQYQKVGRAKRTSAASSTGQRASNSSTSAGGVATISDGAAGGVAPGTSNDVNLFMQNLLEDMVSVFASWVVIVAIFFLAWGIPMLMASSNLS